MVKIRLMRMGATKRPAYRVGVADSRSPRDGRFIENIGKDPPLDDPDAVEVTEESAGGGVMLRLRVAQDDMGKVIGKGGRTARAIRAVVRAAGTKDGVSASVEIVE